MQNACKPIVLAALLAASGAAFAQVPDLLTALDSGGRAMGVGGATRVTDSTTYSALDNPAGLAYITEPTVGTSFRNLPKSTTTAFGNFNDRNFDFTEQPGRTALSHVGYAMPMKGGTLGVSYTIGGHIDNRTNGNNLSNGALTVQGLNEESRAQTDFFTVSYGRQIGNGFNAGVGIVLANQYVKFSQSYTLFNGNTPVGNSSFDASSNGFGVGLVAGVQGYLEADGSAQWGLSIRTPINLTNNNETSAIYDVIPGKLSFGAAGQMKGVGKGEEFLVWAAQVDYNFGGKATDRFGRDNTLGYGLGLEYNFSRYNARIPLRFGFQGVPSMGDGFSSRNAFTFGFGYRPNGQPYSIDFNVARSTETGRYDFGLGFVYKPQK
ncbi:MAG: hypothetical protein JNM28_06280 [Armatimonadetes bacterium]|nr:hypothetical protein [Armatimonadota bacterium]MBS1711611.1 hypothetical protein [Armatimonadota bacterium]MBX3109834.1 hypothetical protein [Fimbriimonadaceae bacterium]